MQQGYRSRAYSKAAISLKDAQLTRISYVGLKQGLLQQVALGSTCGAASSDS